MSSLHILSEDELENFHLFSLSYFMLVVTTISSGRMSSLHILREDELENYLLFSYMPIFMQGNIVSDHDILREGKLFTYPQGG